VFPDDWQNSQGLEYDLDYIDFNNKPAWLFDVNKAGTVPILKDGEKWVPDSGDICEYLAQRYPSPDLGACQVSGVADKLFPSFRAFLTARKEEESDTEAVLVQQLQELDDYLKTSGSFLGGEQMKAFDCLVVRHPACAVFKFNQLGVRGLKNVLNCNNCNNCNNCGDGFYFAFEAQKGTRPNHTPACVAWLKTDSLCRYHGFTICQRHCSTSKTGASQRR
jgi:glutathione S-transferase